MPGSVTPRAAARAAPAPVMAHLERSPKDMKSVLFAVFIVSSLTVRLWASDVLTVSQVIASPATYHGKLIRVTGVFWTDREHSVLLEAPTGELHLDRAIAVCSVPAEMKEDAISEKLKSNCLRFIQQKEKEAPNVRWVAFQAPVVFEGWFQDSASLPAKVGSPSEGLRLGNPYFGCSWKLQVIRVIKYDQKDDLANQAAEPTRTTVTPTADAPVVPAGARGSP